VRPGLPKPDVRATRRDASQRKPETSSRARADPQRTRQPAPPGVNAIWRSRGSSIGRSAHRLRRGTTVNVVRSEEDTCANIVPDAASAEIDIRFASAEAGHRLVADLAGKLGLRKPPFPARASSSPAAYRGCRSRVRGDRRSYEEYAACARASGLARSKPRWWARFRTRTRSRRSAFLASMRSDHAEQAFTPTTTHRGSPRSFQAEAVIRFFFGRWAIKSVPGPVVIPATPCGFRRLHCHWIARSTTELRHRGRLPCCAP